MNNRFLAVSLGILLAGTTTGCSNSVDELTLVTYSSFPAADTDLNDALAEFTEDTGITVNILNAGDTGTMVTKAVLASGNPEGDVMWGIDNTLLSRATAADVFEPYVADAASTFDAQLVGLGDGIVTPVDFGDVCVNYDRSWFADNGLEPPTSLDELTDPAYKGLLAVQHPGTHHPGLRSCSAPSLVSVMDGPPTGRNSSTTTCSSPTIGKRPTTVRSLVPAVTDHSSSATAQARRSRCSTATTRTHRSPQPA